MNKPMQPSYDREDIQELIRQFEGMVRALYTQFNEDQILRFVSLILNNHIQNGRFTDEYINYSRMALQMRKTAGEELNTAQKIILDGFSARPKKI